MKKREQQRQQTRATILSAAEHIYASNGFVQSSTQLIAKEAGVAHGTVFLHFQSQEKLILAVINVLGTDITTRIHESAKQSHSLADVLRTHLTAIEIHESIYSHLIMDMPQLPKEAQQTVIGIQSIIAHHFDQVLNQLKKEKQMKDLPISFIFNTWIGLIHYYLTNCGLFAPHGSVLAIYKDELILNFLKLLEVDKS
ncbi:TetR/AcrR family transcriptional regulator [Sporolactobacillus laevolacticus]|uniref:TetR family transcriptional regulator n=1 Tax=Sporolactobacillus laevolacticus DSM 442 TaxID=1395513 RepID=V6IV96_9BACL|nr:TetR/AcrR family transcriptional regulator [Sporolactobacillus laevolacticus]EST11123.1 TetR family transcriptional regulator [Sporolactobacillus laevolacticus DSM 442]